MNSKFPDDLLSAFHDGEVTPSEEVVAKSLVHSSLKAKDELVDYGRMTGLLRGLPQQAAPAEFSSSVMQRAERESLVPLEESPTGARAWMGVSWTRRRSLIAGAAAAAVAAGLIFAVNLRDRGAKPPSVASNEIGRANKPKDVLALHAVAGKDAATADAPVSSPKPIDPERKTVPRKTVAAASSALVAKRDSNNVPAPPHAASPLHESLLEPTSSDKAPLFDQKSWGGETAQLMFPADLKRAKVGDVVEALEQIGEQVAVVRLTVVNKSEGLDGIENLVVRNVSRTAQNADEIKVLRSRFQLMKKAGGVSVRGTSSKRPGELICVFIEGTRDQLMSLLQDVQNESHIQEARLTNTISASELARYSNGAVAPAAEQAKKRLPARPQVVVRLSAASVDKIVSRTQPGAQQWSLMGIAKDDARRAQSDSKARTLDRSGPGQSIASPRSFAASRKELSEGESRQKVSDLKIASQKAPGQKTSGQPVQSQKDQIETVPSGQGGGRETLARVATARQRSYQAFFFVLEDQKIPPPQQRSAVTAPRPATQQPPADAKPAETRPAE
jgi:hypothetical protein